MNKYSRAQHSGCSHAAHRRVPFAVCHQDHTQGTSRGTPNLWPRGRYIHLPMNRTRSGIPRPILLSHAKPEYRIRPLKSVLFISAIASTISVLSFFSDLGTVTPWFSGSRRPLPARRLVRMRRWFAVKTAADAALVTTAVLGAFVARRGTTGEARLLYQQGMLYTALRLVLSPRILHYVAPAHDDLNLLTCRFWAIDIPALYCFLRAIKYAGAE